MLVCLCTVTSSCLGYKCFSKWGAGSIYLKTYSHPWWGPAYVHWTLLTCFVCSKLTCWCGVNHSLYDGLILLENQGSTKQSTTWLRGWVTSYINGRENKEVHVTALRTYQKLPAIFHALYAAARALLAVSSLSLNSQWSSTDAQLQWTH